MATTNFTFKHFSINQDKSAFRVGTDGVLLGAYADIRGTRRILDIGTGTALIALMLAQRSNAKIVALEPDHDSFLQACENVSSSVWKERIKVLETTLQEYSDNQKFDLIVTNPPWFADSLKNPDSRKSFTRHNDSLPSGVLLTSVSRLLADGGRFQLIMPYVEGNLLIAGAAGYGFYCSDILKIKPLPTSEIRRLILTFGRERVRPMEKFLTIEYGKRHEFTEEYIDLTKDFYLKF
jgi:tRNA1Val (adenine37-N6)-methyltransferase